MMTPVDAADRASLLASLSAHGFLRRPRASRAHREWLHFCVRGEGLDLIVNLSIVDDERVSAGERVRLLVLVRRDTSWHGDVIELDPARVDLPGGQLRARAGSNVIELVGDAIVLRGSTRDGSITFDLALTPESFPSIARDVAVPGGAPINWLVVPRLAARGTVTVAGTRTQLDRAPAYHDHNWGHFTHRDFAWQWGHAHDRELTVVLSRLLDRAQATSYLQTLMVWRGARIARIFRGDDLRVRPSGFLRPGRTLALPRLATLLAAGASEVPRTLTIEARAGADAVTGTFTSEDLARVVVPELDGLRTTIIHEVSGQLSLRGIVHDEPFELEAPAMFELLRSVQ